MYHEMCRQVKFNVKIHLKMWGYSGVIRGVFGGIPGMFGGIRGICGPWNAYVYYICLGTIDVFYNTRKGGRMSWARARCLEFYKAGLPIYSSRILHGGAANIWLGGYLYQVSGACLEQVSRILQTYLLVTICVCERV